MYPLGLDPFPPHFNLQPYFGLVINRTYCYSKELDELYDTSDSDTDGTDGGDVVAEADDGGGDIRDDLILAINNVLGMLG